jgi:hypothetical protein
MEAVIVSTEMHFRVRCCRNPMFVVASVPWSAFRYALVASAGEEIRVFVPRSARGAFTGKSRRRSRLDCGELGNARINLGQTLGEFSTEFS